MAIYHKLRCLWLWMLLLLLIIPSGCVGSSSGGGHRISPAALFDSQLLPPLPLAGESRIASAPDTTELDGDQTFDRGGQWEESGGNLILTSDTASSSWAMYELLTGGHPVIQAAVHFELLEDATFFIAVADYSTSTWRFSEVTGGNEFTVPLTADAVSGAGAVYLVVLAAQGSSVEIDKVELTIDHPIWTVYTFPFVFYRGLTMFVQDGMPAIAYLIDTLNTDTVYYMRATVPLPTTPEQWTSHVVEARGLPEEISDVLTAASIAGKPALVYMEENDDLLIYARAKATTPSSTEDWVVTTVYNADSFLDSQLALAECVGTPRIAFQLNFGAMCLATTTTGQPSPLDWEIVYVTDSEVKANRPAMAAVDNKPIIAMSTDLGEGYGLHVGYAKSHTPPTPTDWDIIPVYPSQYAGYVSSVALQEWDSDLRPVLSYTRDLGDRVLCVSRPTVTEPTSELDWVNCVLESHVSNTAITVADNRPVVVYFSGQAGGIRVAMARTPEFSADTDFEIVTLREGWFSTTASMDAISIDDVPMIAFFDEDADRLAFGYCSY